MIKPVEDIYFPISPKYAILMPTKDIKELVKNKKDLTFDEVKYFNNMIAEMSLEQLYGNSNESLQPYVKKLYK